jgi:hypothetical protein
MTLVPDGNLFKNNLESVELSISKYFPNKEDAASFARELRTKFAQDAIWQSTIITTTVKYVDSYVLIVTITFSDGISKKMLGKLNALFYI